MPTSVGYQDLAALVAHERGASTGWHLIASPLGTVQAATFNYTRPIGTTIGEPAGLINVNFDPRTLDTYAWKIDEPITVQRARQIEYPSVNRAHKGDRLPASNVAPAPRNSGEPAAIAADQRAGFTAGLAGSCTGAATCRDATRQNRAARRRRRAARRADGYSPRCLHRDGAGGRLWR